MVISLTVLNNNSQDSWQNNAQQTTVGILLQTNPQQSLPSPGNAPSHYCLLVINPSVTARQARNFPRGP
jgi:hypothetical protein